MLIHLLLQRGRAFVGVSAYRSSDPAPLAARNGAHAVHIAVTGVDGNFFDVLGVRPSLGRLLQPQDDVPDGPDLVVLSDLVWHRDFGGDRHIIGRLVFFAGADHRVIGIAPPDFSYPAKTTAWTPILREIHRQDPENLYEALGQWGFFMVGRLRRGITRQAALTELDAALRTDSAAGTYSEFWGALPTDGVVEGYANVVFGKELRPIVMILFCAVGLVLIISCTNIAGLLLARDVDRTMNVAVRSALGAKYGQLLTYLLSESVLLGVSGGVLGLVLGAALLRVAVVFAPSDLPIATAHLDPSVITFAGILPVASIVGFGVAPAMRGARSAPHGVLQLGAQSTTSGPLTRMARRTLVTAQVALALVVLCGAGVLGRTLERLQRSSLGFAPDHLLFFRPDLMLPSSAVSPSVLRNRWHPFVGRLAERLPVTPGLGPMTTTLTLPFSGETATIPYVLDGQRPLGGGRFARTNIDLALPNYFKVLDIPLLRGRTFTERDNDAHGAPVVIVNNTFAHQVWPNQEPLGRGLRFVGDTSGRSFTVVGVVGNAKYVDLAAQPPATVYETPDQTQGGDPWLAVRTRGDPARAAGLLEQVISATDPAFGISRTYTGAELLSARLAKPRALAVVFAGLAGTALLLAAIGLFGVLSAYVRERRRGMAIRSALGATPNQLRFLVAGQAIIVASVGVTCGLPLAVLSSHVLQSIVSNVRPVDLPTVLGAILALLAVVAIATYEPVLRASRVDARTALTSE